MNQDPLGAPPKPLPPAAGGSSGPTGDHGRRPLSPERLALDVAGLMCATADPRSAAEAFVSQLGRAMPVRASLLTWDAERHRAAWYLQGETEPFPLSLLGEKRSLLRTALEERRPILVENPGDTADCPERRYLRRSGGSWAFLPLVAAGQSAGCLILRASAPTTLSAEALGAIGSALPALTLALRAGHLQRELEARVEERTGEIALLYDISKSIGYVANLDDLVSLVGSALQRAVPCDMHAITLLLPDRREMTVDLAAPADDAAIRKLNRQALAELRRVSARRTGRVTVSVRRPEAGDDDARIQSGDLRSIANVPIYVRGEPLGMISVASRDEGAIGEAQMRLMHTIANQASLSLDRLRTAHEAEESRVHSVLQSMAEGVLLLDADLRIVMSNPASQAYLAVLLGGPNPRALTRLGDVRLRPLLHALSGEGPRSHAFEVPAPHEGRMFSVACSPVRGVSGEAQGLVVVISDVTEARKLQIQVAQSEKLSALGEMISGVAHELNNPLASVMAFAQLLQKEDVGEEVKRKLRAIDNEATRCRKIVQNLLRFARHHTPERREVDINEIVESVLQLLAHQLKVDDVDTSVDLAPDLRRVVGDAHLLQQVFVNIVYNAYQAMKDNGSPGHLLIRSRNEDERVIVEVSDDGPGIPPQIIGRIFDPFFSTKEVGKGTGLGLSLAYGTVRQHGGAISVRSRPGSGSTFIVDLPGAPPAEPASVEREAASAGAPLTGPPELARERQVEARRILVIEDEATLAEVLVEVLEAEGYKVDTAGDGATARAKIEVVRYDLIISDLKMPNMNGREFYRHVKALEPDLARRILFSTGDTANPDTQAFFQEVGNPFLAKPFNLADLLRVVDSMLAGA